jgi:hypothetical protein
LHPASRILQKVVVTRFIMQRSCQRFIVLGAALALTATACAADDPIGVGSFADDSEFQTCLASDSPSDTHDEADSDADAGHVDGDDHESADAAVETHDEDAEDADHGEAEEADHDEAEDGDHHEAEDGDHETEALTSSDVEMAFEIEMSEFAYSCVLPDLPAGTVVALRFTNEGLVEHEAVVGDLAAQNDAEMEMAEMAEGEGGHGAHSAASLTLAPGDRGDLIVQFDDPGEVIIGCHIPGHWDSGMHREFQVLDT